MNYAIPVGAKTEVREKVLVRDKDGKDVEEEKTVALSMPEFVRLAMRNEYKPIKRPPVIGGQGGYHGIVFVPNVLERTPAYVEDVVPGSPADKAGLRPDDLVSFVDGEPVVSINAFGDFVKRNTRPGTVVRLEVRRGEALQTVELTLGAHPGKPAPPAPARGGDGCRSGLRGAVMRGAVTWRCSPRSCSCSWRTPCSAGRAGRPFWGACS